MKHTKKKRKPAQKAKKKKKMTSGELFRTKLAAFCPHYLIDEDDDGQIIINTGLRDDGDDNYVLWHPDDYVCLDCDVDD